jgi:hypothetical protein
LTGDGDSLRTGGASGTIHGVGAAVCAAGDGCEGGLMVTDVRNRRGEEGTAVRAATDDDGLAQTSACWELTCHISNIDVFDIDAIDGINLDGGLAGEVVACDCY